MDIVFKYIWTPIAVFVVGYILLRIMGKKAVSEMTSFDLLAVLVLGTAISEPVVTKRLGIASYYSASIALLFIVFSYLNINNRLKKLLNPRPTVLIQAGDINEKGLKKERMTVSELVAQIRKKGYTNTSDIEVAIMEEIGGLSVIPKADIRPIQPKDMQLSPQPAFIPIPLIIDGVINDHNLQYLKLDREWLYQQLLSYKVKPGSLHKVSLAVYNQRGKVTADIKNENPDFKPQF